MTTAPATPEARGPRQSPRPTHLTTYVALANHSEAILADSLDVVGRGHAQHPDVLFTCQALEAMSRAVLKRLRPVVERYGEADADRIPEPERLRWAGLTEVRRGPVGLLRDLQDLHLMATLTHSTWTVINQGAQGLRDTDLTTIAQDAMTTSSRQLAWFTTRMKVAAPQALIVAR